MLTLKKFIFPTHEQMFNFYFKKIKDALATIFGCIYNTNGKKSGAEA